MVRPVPVLAAALLAAVTLLGGCASVDGGGGPSSPRLSVPPVITESPTDDDQAIPSYSMPPTTPTRGVARDGVCAGEHLHSSLVDSGRAGTYRWVVVAVTNLGPHTCRIVGYPELSAIGTRRALGLAQSAILPLTLQRGRVSDRRDPGPHSIGLPYGASASFAALTSTRQSRQWTITRLGTRPSGAYGYSPLAVSLDASQTGFAAAPVTVTAFVPGRAGPPLIPKPTKKPTPTTSRR